MRLTDRIGHWPWSLVPWRVDHETLVVSDILAAIQIVASAFCFVEGPWVVFAGPVTAIAIFVQLLISIGIAGTRLLGRDQPVHAVRWPRAMRGFLISAAAIGAWYLVDALR